MVEGKLILVNSLSNRMRLIPAVWAARIRAGSFTLLFLVAGVPPTLAQMYSITDLGTLGGSSSTAEGINNSGQVVGDALDAGGNQHAFLYSGGVMTDLGTLGGSYSQAWGINNNGQVVGDAANASGNQHAFLYSGGVMSDLGTLGGAWSRAEAHQQQRPDRRLVRDDWKHGWSTRFPVQWRSDDQPGRTFPGWGSSTASAINNEGEVVGSASPEKRQTAPSFIRRGDERLEQ